jgi:hypothetical protein
VTSEIQKSITNMESVILDPEVSKTSSLTARVSIAACGVASILLASLHMLSPEFEPSWRMVSEYALGHYGWVLSFMFICWAISSWALAFTVKSQVQTKGGRIGLVFLFLSGIGAAMASVFEVPTMLHNVAAIVGIPTFPVAALLISNSLTRNQTWWPARRILLLAANCTWIAIVLFMATMVILIATYTQSGGDMNAAPATTLPAGVIAINGWANRLLILVDLAWMSTVAWQAIRLRIVR